MQYPLSVPYFDNANIELDNVGPDDAEHPGERAAWAAFMALSSTDRLSDSRHLFAYYRDFHILVSGADWLDDKMGIVTNPHDIWPHVRPKIIWSTPDPKSDAWFIEIEADCAWEEEHGVHMVWENGGTLIKAGGYDGHPRNWFETPTPQTDLIVYSAINEGLSTLRDT